MTSFPRALLAMVALLATCVAWRASAAAGDVDASALSELPRVLSEGERLPCRAGDMPLVRHRGQGLRYSRVVRVHPEFVPRLRAFEAVVQELALRHYGRVPRRIVHLGTYNCRRMRRYPDWVSEHALGNAIDVAGFDFSRLPRGETSPEGMPRRLRRPFSVRVDTHFRARRGVGARHAAFLHDLTRALVARADIFSVVLGPGFPGHENHLHLDAAPYRVVDVDLPAPAVTDDAAAAGR